MASGRAQMNIAVLGMWHLGTVTAGCLAKAGHSVIGFDQKSDTVAMLKNGLVPVNEPGLSKLIRKSIERGQLSFSSDLTEIACCDIFWVAYDTPVDEDDRADIGFVMSSIEALFPHLKDGDLIIISSQLPVGTTSQLEARLRANRPNLSFSFACLPENLRLGTAIEVFTNPDRVVAGVRGEEDKARIARLLAPFTDKIIWMSVESAEMTKHAINAFLATSVCFINELAGICECYGADASEVEQGLKSDTRIGLRAYLRPGPAFSGGTLARDIIYLLTFGREKKLHTPLFEGVLKSNESHKNWPRQKLADLLGSFEGKRVALLGLTYKPGTDTLRRSESLEHGRWLKSQGAELTAYDPLVEKLPPELEKVINLCATLGEALEGAQAVLIATPWPELRKLKAEEVATKMDRPVVVDPSGYLAEILENDPRIVYLSVGRTHETCR